MKHIKKVGRRVNFRIAIRISILLFSSIAGAERWIPVGPDGGDARSLAYDPGNPSRIFLGTSAGKLYVSGDSGASWSRFAQLSSSSDLVLDNIVIDPNNSRLMYVAGWSVQSGGGDLYRSKNGGRSW